MCSPRRAVATRTRSNWSVRIAGTRPGTTREISVRHARTAERKTNDDLQHGVFVTSWQRVSPADRTYLVAAAHTRSADGESRTADIAEHLGRVPSATTAMRDRLINRHALLYSPARGVVRFTLPGFADWVIRQSAAQVPQIEPTRPTLRK